MKVSVTDARLLADHPGLPVLAALNQLGKPMYQGTVPAKVRARRRAANRRARISRRISRRHP